jgi:hypothetical protein
MVAIIIAADKTECGKLQVFSARWNTCVFFNELFSTLTNQVNLLR